MPPPRLYCLLASEAPRGVVIRRGPSQLCQLLTWDRDKDSFKSFEKFSGRLHPERSDISPDGEHLLYFAVGRWKGTFGTWTCIGRVGRRNAQVVWGVGGTWGGGGIFVNDREYWLYESPVNAAVLHKNVSNLSRLLGAEPALPAHVSERVQLGEGWTLLKASKGYRMASESEPAFEFPDWEWAGWDRSRLVWAQSGKLYGAALKRSGLGATYEIYDFNDADE